MKKALLINVSDIGDIVSSSIVLDSLIEQSYEVSFLMPKFVHALWDIHPSVKLITEKTIPDETFDLVVDLTSDKGSRKIVRTIKAREKIGRVKDTWQRLRHWVTYTKMVRKKWDGHIVGDYYPILSALEDNRKRNPTLTGTKQWPISFNFTSETKVVAIHFGAHNPKRVIPENLLSHAIESLTQLGYKIVLIGTEEEIAADIIRKNHQIPLYRKLSLSEVKSVLLCSELFIGADSGILHIASALGVNSIGVYGPNVPRRSGPKNPQVSFFEQDLECRPCNQNVECPIAVKCMMTLDKNTFINLINQKLKLS
jgi:ADP-heptose:LPS heptosyltransferase